MVVEAVSEPLLTGLTRALAGDPDERGSPTELAALLRAAGAAVAPWAKEKGEEIKDRVNPLIDVDVFGGVLLPYRDSLFVTSERNENKTPLDQKLGRALPTFGMTFEAGTTF